VGRIIPDDADPGSVAGAITCVVDTPTGERPFRVHIDPVEDGASVAFSVIDRIRDDMLRRMGLADLLRPALHLTRRTRHQNTQPMQAIAILAIGAVSGLVGGSAMAQFDNRVEERNKAIVQASFDAWRAGAGSPYDLLADDASWTITGHSAAAKTYPS
jgi:hypothetical protein